jgi:hypothetical protein
MAPSTKPAAKPRTKAKASKSKAKPGPAAKVKKKEFAPVDLTSLPQDAVREEVKWLCLACILDVFTRHLGMAVRTAYSEIRKHSATLAELTASEPVRPYFSPSGDGMHCPHCGSAARWHARMPLHRIEGGRATDAARRKLVNSLPVESGEFQVLEEKSTQREAFYQWLEKQSGQLDFEQELWLTQAAHAYLQRKEPKTDWDDVFARIHSVRRSLRLTEGWEIDGGRLFLSPPIYDEVLLVQYLVSRSHKAGGLTFEGRLTLHEMVQRLRRHGFLRSLGIARAGDSDVFEAVIEHLAGGDESVKFHFILDRRDLLEKLKNLRSAGIPRPKRAVTGG